MTKQLNQFSALERLMTSLERADTHYRKHRDLKVLETNLISIAGEFRDYMGVGDLFVHRGEMLFDKGDPDGGICYLQIADEIFRQINNRVTLYLRIAQYELERGNKESGILYLQKLCTEGADNYEEVIAANELTDVWEKYRHLVDGTVPKSVPLMEDPRYAPLSPDECSMQIDAIFELPESELLTELAVHLDELSGKGSNLSCLNRWEKIVYDLDRLVEEVASGGFIHYVYYHGTRFQQTKGAVKKIGAPITLLLMDRVERLFPGGVLPTELSQLQDAVDEIDEDETWEQLDAQYYDEAEDELIRKLYAYVLINRSRFR
jgi:tetratricopeptide (TPR) repeat protein